MHANGMPWKDIVEAIRAEAWDVPDARPGTTDHTLTRKSEPEDSTR
jgi:hypothetical protein